MLLFNKTAKGLRVQEISNVAKPILQTPGCHLGTPNYSSMSTKRTPSGWRTSPEPSWSKHEYGRYSARLKQPIIYLSVRKGFYEGWVLRKAIFHFLKLREKSTYHGAFSNEMIKLLNYWISSSFRTIKTFPALRAFKITHLKWFTSHVPRVTPLELFEETPFICCQQVLSSRSSYLWPHYFHQAIRIRGHGFSKRFIPAGVYSSTHTNQPLAPPRVARQGSTDKEDWCKAVHLDRKSVV